MVSHRVIITGINGFVGEHVSREFQAKGWEVTGVGTQPQSLVKVGDLLSNYISCNLLDSSQVASLPLHDADVVVHLAGLSNQGASFDKPKQYMHDNGEMTRNLLESALEQKSRARMIIISTGALYDPRQPLPLSETSATKATSPYGVGKLFVEQIAEYYASRGLDTITVRPFNHIGPGQEKGFIVPDLYAAVLAAQETGSVQVGNIYTKRDYTDVRDVATAYLKLAESKTLNYRLYNVCSGNSLSGEDILHELQTAMGIKSITLEVDQTRIRPTDIAEIIGDNSRITSDIDWHPSIGHKQTIQDFIQINTAD